MISYYKYTEGDAFTLNGVDYVGFFNVIDGKAYTGKIKTESSQKLSPKQTFTSEIYIRQLEFDSTYEQSFKLSTTLQNKFDIFTKSNLEKLIDTINLNNINIYKSLVFQNPNFLSFVNSNSYFYGLSSTDADMRNTDEIYAKNVYTQIDPFEFDAEWSFLDNIKSGSFIVKENDDFVYFCNDDYNTYSLLGSFTNFSEKLTISQVSQDTNIIKNVLIDDIDLNIFLVTSNSVILYEYEPFIKCGNLLKKDEISLQNDLIFVKIGNSIRLEITKDSMYIKNKYSNDIFYKTTIDSFNLGTILNCQVRMVDDLIVIVSKKDEKFYISYIDSEFPDKILNQFEMLFFEDLKFDLQFSELDSNIVIIIFENYSQVRYISNSKYPASNSNQSDQTNFNYLKKYSWDSNNPLIYDYSNKIKWNSNSLKSNSYNNILIDSKNIGNVTYVIIHNVGRIYVIKKPLYENFKIFKIPKNLKKSFINVGCSNSSFGLYLNNTLKNIIIDTINIFTSSECKTKLSQDAFNITISELENVKISIENMFFNGNEQLNVPTLNRIFETIIELQRKLIN